MTTWLIIALAMCIVCGVGLALIARRRKHKPLKTKIVYMADTPTVVYVFEEGATKNKAAFGNATTPARSLAAPALMGRTRNCKWRRLMKTSKNRHDGGAYRQYKTMIAAHAKAGKDRSKARRKQRKKVKK